MSATGTKCDICHRDIDKEYLKVSKGYCEACGNAVVKQAIEDYKSASEKDRLKFKDEIVAEMLSRGII